MNFRLWELEEAEKLWNDAYLDNFNIPHWKSNDHIPMSDMLKKWKYLNKEFDYELSLEKHNEQTHEEIEQYKNRMKNYVPSEEELYEMRCAFGKGTEVVDIFTGQKINI